MLCLSICSTLSPTRKTPRFSCAATRVTWKEAVHRWVSGKMGAMLQRPDQVFSAGNRCWHGGIQWAVPKSDQCHVQGIVQNGQRNRGNVPGHCQHFGAIESFTHRTAIVGAARLQSKHPRAKLEQLQMLISQCPSEQHLRRIFFFSFSTFVFDFSRDQEVY